MGDFALAWTLWLVRIVVLVIAIFSFSVLREKVGKIGMIVIGIILSIILTSVDKSSAMAFIICYFGLWVFVEGVSA